MRLSCLGDHLAHDAHDALALRPGRCGRVARARRPSSSWRDVAKVGSLVGWVGENVVLRVMGKMEGKT